ncbi:hypothetical protein FA15DRAFT_391138 [Coprinopsis marcescibilis]|uniref:Uncharacterized protein n=1 Tax=Coprinopsis marcescibilis TaxID=230819 RepID=A0A5C3KW13_COPMA|nr:hypothetical protein FA15DRAFT_391138 [Coprinopsis marcescibilis]
MIIFRVTTGRSWMMKTPQTEAAAVSNPIRYSCLRITSVKATTGVVAHTSSKRGNSGVSR